MPKTRERMTPLELTQSVLDISVTERETFNLCERRWELTVLENLEPRVPTDFNLEFGTGIHRALEGFYFAKANQPALPDTKATRLSPLTSALYHWDEWYCEEDTKLWKNDDLLTSDKEALADRLEAIGDLGEEMLRGYFQYTKFEDNFTAHAIEGKITPAGTSWLKKHSNEREFFAEHSASAVVLHEPSNRLLVPIIHPKTKRPLKRGAMLSMRLDLIARSTESGLKGLWIFDHKTTASQPNDRNLDFDDQITGYCYGLWRWLGIVPRGVCMNFLIKKAPRNPRVLKSGKLSYDKSQLVTPGDYRQALIDHGLMLKDGTVTSDDHAAAYELFLSRDWDPFFQRFFVTRNRAELEAFEERLYDEYIDMVDCERGDRMCRPNFSPPHYAWCTKCSVASICQAIEDGSDVESIIDTRYRDKPDRKAVR